MELPDREVCYRAFQTRDPRFDGLVFVGVTSTGIYCRPICPARSPKLENCRYFSSAAAAQQAGFRPCLRCRPESAPDLPSWRGTSNTVLRALSLINDGALDSDERGVEELAERLGVGERQLRRLFLKHLGAPPIAVAQTRRVLFAKQLIHETQLSMAEIAFASGFGSIRRFNETFRNLFHRPPSALRRKNQMGSSDMEAAVTLRLRYRHPYDWNSVLGHLRARAISGVEAVGPGCYSRTVEIEGFSGTIEVGHLPERQSLNLTIRFPNVRYLPHIVTRVRRLFDVGADIETINDHLSRDPLLAPLISLRPGLRVPGGWDGFELAARAILGQQVTVVAARKLGEKFVSIYGQPLKEARENHFGLSRLFPKAESIAQSDLSGLGMPRARRAALKALAEAVVSDPNLFRPFGTIEEAIARLRTIQGIGEWTAQYIALRILRETDAFPASDIGLIRGVTALGGARPTPTELLRRSEQWRPWRAYAAQHLWVADGPLSPASVSRQSVPKTGERSKLRSKAEANLLGSIAR